MKIRRPRTRASAFADHILCPNYVLVISAKVDQRLFWHVVDEIDYLPALLRLRILDALAGPQPETPADQQRERDRERIEGALTEIEL